jgi:spore maturation protein CgeB
MVLVLKGESLDASLIKKARAATGAVFVNWFQDSVTVPVLRKLAVSVSGGYDFFFGIDSPEVLEICGLRSGRTGFLPMGFDPDIYRKMDMGPGDAGHYGSDVAFVGTMVPNRVAAFERLGFQGLKIWGPPVSVHGPWLTGASPLAPCYTGVAPLGEEAAKVYSASSIIIGMHCNFGEHVSNVTPRLFEVPGCGGFLLTDHNSQVGLFFDTQNEMATYRDLPELKEKVRYFLGNPSRRAEMAERAHRRAHAEHTYKHRLQQMFSLVEGRA